MNIKTSVLTSLLLSVGFVSGCQQDVEQAPTTDQSAQAAAPQATVQQPRVVDLVPAPMAAPTASMANGLATGAVVETMAAGGYTYAMIEVAGKQIWAAGPPTPMSVGDTITFSTMIPMKDFHSKALNRDFPVLYFVDGFSTLNSGVSTAQPSAVAAPATAPAAAVVAIGNIEKVEGGYTIAEILAQRNELTGKPIKVRGQVTKVVNGIMGKNWVHISDSSGDADFIVTTSGTASNGQVIVAEGMLALNRDFGYGYKYDILMEDATVTAE